MSPRKKASFRLGTRAASESSSKMRDRLQEEFSKQMDILWEYQDRHTSIMNDGFYPFVPEELRDHPQVRERVCKEGPVGMKSKWWGMSTSLEAMVALEAWADWFLGFNPAALAHPPFLVLGPLCQEALKKAHEKGETGPYLFLEAAAIIRDMKRW